MMKLIVLFFLLAASYSSAAQPTQSSTSSGQSIYVMSFNIRSDTGGEADGTNGWYYRQKAVMKMFNEKKPDICGMQEVRPGQLSDIINDVKGYQFYGVDRNDGTQTGKDERMVIMWNKKVIKVLESDTFWLSETPDVPSKGWGASYYRTAAWAKCRHIPSGKDFFFICTHLDNSSGQARSCGLQLIIERMSSLNKQKLPMILVGDFNVTPDNNCLKLLDGYMLSAREYATPTVATASFNGFGGLTGVTARILDYIYFNGFASCRDFQVIEESYLNVPYISDHYPISVNFFFE